MENKEIKQQLVQKLQEINVLIKQAKQQSIITEINIDSTREFGDYYDMQYVYLKRFYKIENI